MLKSNKKLFNKICYGVFKCNDLKLLNVAKKRVSKISSKFGFKFNPGSFSKVSAEKLNNYMKNVNKELEPLSIDIINSFSKTIKLFFGNKIAIQKKPYIRINCKHLINTATIPHADFDFGHSPVGYNIWVPLFDVFGKSGIYVYSLSESKLIYKNFKFNKRLDEHINTIKKKKKIMKKIDLKNKFLRPKFSEAIILSNLNIHGAINDKDSLPRISVNLHFQNTNAPYGEKGTEFFKFASFDENTNRYKIVSV